jgi:hypothetical protein
MVNTCFMCWFMLLTDAAGKRFDGLVPERSQERDSVVVLQGCSVPVVLRRSRRCKGDVFWELVGECFVYGVMDGETMADSKYQSKLYEYELV